MTWEELVPGDITYLYNPDEQSMLVIDYLDSRVADGCAWVEKFDFPLELAYVDVCVDDDVFETDTWDLTEDFSKNVSQAIQDLSWLDTVAGDSNNWVPYESDFINKALIQKNTERLLGQIGPKTQQELMDMGYTGHAWNVSLIDSLSRNVKNEVYFVTENEAITFANSAAAFCATVSEEFSSRNGFELIVDEHDFEHGLDKGCLGGGYIQVPIESSEEHEGR